MCAVHGAKDAIRAPPREVHVSIASHEVGAFVEGDRAAQMCFRCGQAGHMRFQCLTYKVRLCWHHQKGECHDRACTFAHGPDELRTPWKQRCVRVVRQPSGQYVCIGCNSTEHTFRRCPHHGDLLLL
jgi:hypothetical protein